MGMSGWLRDAYSELLADAVLLVQACPRPTGFFWLSVCDQNCCVHTTLHGASGQVAGRVGKRFYRGTPWHGDSGALRGPSGSGVASSGLVPGRRPAGPL